MYKEQKKSRSKLKRHGKERPTCKNKGVCPTNDCSNWDDFTVKNVLKNLVSFSAQKQAQQNSDPNVQ
jgi:hypothetical protein